MMKITNRLLIVCMLNLIVLAAAAQTRDKVLVPLGPRTLAGANGSTWQTDVVITNMSGTPLGVSGFMSSTHCGPLCGDIPPIPPHATVFATESLICDTRGIYLYVDAGRSNDLAATLRSRDLSRQAETWGTTIPVVKSEDLYSSTFGISDVPMEPQFRSTLRVYNVDAQGQGAVALRFYALNPMRVWPTFPNQNPDQLLLEMRPAFIVPTSGGGTASCPSFFEIAMDQRPELASAQRLRIEIEPLDGRKAYWGFVSTTHNQTQHVTVVSPN